jgi:hypothetical protein
MEQKALSQIGKTTRLVIGAVEQTIESSFDSFSWICLRIRGRKWRACSIKEYREGTYWNEKRHGGTR